MAQLILQSLAYGREPCCSSYIVAKYAAFILGELGKILEKERIFNGIIFKVINKLINP